MTTENYGFPLFWAQLVYEGEGRIRPWVAQGALRCSKGHDYTIANTRFKKSDGSLICRQCKNERQAKRPARKPWRKSVAGTDMSVRMLESIAQTESIEDIDTMARINENRATLPWNYNKPKAPAELAELNKQLESQRSACFERPAEFTDYAVAPQRDIARQLCVSCPVFEMCATWAKAERPAWGIYAGEAWEDGKRV